MSAINWTLTFLAGEGEMQNWKRFDRKFITKQFEKSIYVYSG